MSEIGNHNSSYSPQLDPETRAFVNGLMGFAMGSAAETRAHGERTPEMIEKEKAARKIDLLQYAEGDAHQAQLILDLYERCGQIAWAIEDNPTVVWSHPNTRQRVIDPYKTLARVIYGDNYDKQEDLSSAAYQGRQEVLTRLESATNAFDAALKPKEVREYGIDDEILFTRALQAIDPSIGDKARAMYNLAEDYFTAGGGIEHANAAALR